MRSGFCHPVQSASSIAGEKLSEPQRSPWLLPQVLLRNGSLLCAIVNAREYTSQWSNFQHVLMGMWPTVYTADGNLTGNNTLEVIQWYSDFVSSTRWRPTSDPDAHIRCIVRGQENNPKGTSGTGRDRTGQFRKAGSHFPLRRIK